VSAGATRREALLGAGGLALGAGLALAGCGAGGPAATATGSTLRSTWGDPVGDGQLRVLAGEPVIDRTELGPLAEREVTLTTIAHLADAHVLDASSPARVPFLNRLGPPFQSTFRPHEALTVQVLAGAVNAVRALRPQLVVQGGDLIDNDQVNELAHALTVLHGGRVAPGSGRDGYFGVQLPSDTDPFYYRPDIDAPLHPGLLRASVRPFTARGVAAPVYPVLGDHDGLVAGEVVPTSLTRALAVGDRALWDLPPGLSLPPGTRASALGSPDGPPSPGLVDVFLHNALAGPTVRVAPDPSRAELRFDQVTASLRAAAAPPTRLRADSLGAPRLDYTLDAGPRVRVIVLDIVRRAGGSGGLIDPSQPAWLERELAAAGDRWVLVVSHMPLESSAGGDELLAVMDRAPRVIAALSGHTHRNRITPRFSAAGGYWLISTASLIDYPQQARAVQVLSTRGGGVAIRTWMLDHVAAGELGRLGAISRELSYLDAQGGRPAGFAGAPPDRNALLHRRAVS
jgi:3',5'-cyclic AMP phosphodiesterase CpdA